MRTEAECRRLYARAMRSKDWRFMDEVVKILSELSGWDLEIDNLNNRILDFCDMPFSKMNFFIQNSGLGHEWYRNS